MSAFADSQTHAVGVCSHDDGSVLVGFSIYLFKVYLLNIDFGCEVFTGI